MDIALHVRGWCARGREELDTSRTLILKAKGLMHAFARHREVDGLRRKCRNDGECLRYTGVKGAVWVGLEACEETVSRFRGTEIDYGPWYNWSLVTEKLSTVTIDLERKV